MSIKSIKHSKEKRVLIPSREEAGAEAASPKVKEGKNKAEFPVNPVVNRGQDPELFWLHKYGADDRQDRLAVDIRSLYRHEHIAPETIIQRLYSLKEVPQAQMELAGLFGNGPELDEIDKVSEYYQHSDNWSNRLIQGDSLLVMSSLLEREGMAGKVQMIYIDPPYGIKYGSNWQMKLNNPNIKDGADEDLSGEPEQIKAYRDTWELGIHSYLNYLRDRLLVAKELLTESGSCFVQISDENVHLVRCLMDEVFGSENFVSQILFQKTGGFAPRYISNIGDHILWYAQNKETLKYRKLFELLDVPPMDDPNYVWLEMPSGEIRRMTPEERRREVSLPKDARVFRYGPLQSSGSSNTDQHFEWKGKSYYPSKNNHWKVPPDKLAIVAEKKQLIESGEGLSWKLFWDYNKAKALPNIWLDTQSGGFNESGLYVVQTTNKVIQRCLLMTTDPGDLVLDPTSGSGTTAQVAEQWGRRWITIDTSRIAINITKTRLISTAFPYFKLHDENMCDIRQGFKYKRVSHFTLGALAYNEQPNEETLFDQPEVDKKKLRVSGPFTVETLQNFEPVAPEELDRSVPDAAAMENFEERIFEHMKSAGVKNGIRNEQAVFKRIDRLNSGYLHAEGFYDSKKGEKKAYIHIGPKFGTVSREAVNEAVKECRKRGDADWLIVLGFSFESNIENQNVTTSVGSFEVTKVRMHDDLMQDGLLKKDKKAASFVTIGEPDIQLVKKGKTATVEIRGLDIYDPVTDVVKARDVADIAYWMVDDDYDGSNFIVRQVFFCGGDKDQFADWQKGLSTLAVASTKRNAEKTLKIEIDDEAFERLYGHMSHPIEIKKGQKIAVRVISQFGEESTKVLEA